MRKNNFLMRLSSLLSLSLSCLVPTEAASFLSITTMRSVSVSQRIWLCHGAASVAYFALILGAKLNRISAAPAAGDFALITCI